MPSGGYFLINQKEYILLNIIFKFLNQLLVFVQSQTQVTYINFRQNAEGCVPRFHAETKARQKSKVKGRKKRIESGDSRTTFKYWCGVKQREESVIPLVVVQPGWQKSGTQCLYNGISSVLQSLIYILIAKFDKCVVLKTHFL